MSTSIAPSFGPGAAASPVASSSASGARGRSADEPDGRSFHAVLERSRGGSAQPGEEASPLEGAARRKPGRGTDRREELAAEPLPLAFFAPMPGSLPAAGLPAGAPVAAGGAQAATPGLVTDAATGDVPAADAGPAVASADEAASSTQAQPADVPAPAAPQADGDQAKPDAPAPAALPADAISQSTAEADTLAADATAVPAPVANAARSATPDAAAAGLPIPAQDDAAATSIATDVVARAAEPPAQEPPTPAASIVLGSPPSMALESARTSVPPATVHTPTLTVEPSVGSEAWGRAIGQQMLRMSAAGYQGAELNLNPAGLGPLKVTLSMADNQAQAMFFSAHESVRRAVEAALPQLRASMADSGISLGQASVGAEAHPSPGQGGAYGQDAQQQQQQASARRADRPAFGAETAAAAAPASSLAPAAGPRRANAGVDTFA
jgi:flagellar hook-length control protein FliK